MYDSCNDLSLNTGVFSLAGPGHPVLSCGPVFLKALSQFSINVLKFTFVLTITSLMILV